MQVALEGGFSAHAHGFAVRFHRAVVPAPGRFVQPAAIGFAELFHQPEAIPRGQFADRADFKPLQLRARFWPDAVDLAAGQRPDQGLQIFRLHDADAIRLVEFACHLGQQLVGCHAHRTGELRGVEDRLLDALGQYPATIFLAAGDFGEVDVHLIHPAVFHHRRDAGDDGLEQARIVAITVEVHRQQNRLRTQPRRLHHAHGRAHAKGARRVSGGGDHTAAGVVAEPVERLDRNLGVALAVLLTQRQIVAARAAANHHRQPLELRIAQQLDGREKGIHIEVGDAAGQGRRTHA